MRKVKKYQQGGVQWGPWMLNQVDAGTPVGQTWESLNQFGSPFTTNWGNTMFNIGDQLRQGVATPVADPGTDYKAFWKNYAKSQGWKFNPGDQITAEQEKQASEAFGKATTDYQNYKQKLEGIGPAMNIIGPLGALLMGNKGEQAYKSKPKDNLQAEQGFYGFNYQRGGNINTTGYTPGTPTMNNSYNIIPGGNITMKNTPFPVLGISNTGQKNLMFPGLNYSFPGAKYVKEIPMRQMGGEAELAEIQTEKGEYIAHLNGDITPVKAKKLHKQMEDDDVTDIVPEGSYIFSRDKKMILDKEKSLGGVKLKDIALGYGAVNYSESNPDTSLPKEVLFADVINKRKFTPAEAAKAISNKFPISDREHDAFVTHAQNENKMSRQAYLSVLQGVSELKKPQKFQYGGFPDFMCGGKTKHQYGEEVGALDSLISQVQEQAAIPTKHLVLQEKGDPYEYRLTEGGQWQTRKKGKGSWMQLNSAGIAEVSKRVLQGRYDKGYKGSPAKMKTNDGMTTKGYNHFFSVKPQEQTVAGDPNQLAIDAFNSWPRGGVPQPVQQTQAVQQSVVPQMNRSFSQNPYWNQLSNFLYNNQEDALNQFKNFATSRYRNFQLGGLADPGMKRDNALREPISPIVNYNRTLFPMRFKNGGRVPKYQWEGVVGSALPFIGDLFGFSPGAKAAKEQKKNMRETLRELEYLKRVNSGYINDTANAGYATAMSNYLTQDPSYTYLDLSSPFQRTDDAYSSAMNNMSAEKAGLLSMANQGMNSFMRNAASLGLSPTQAAAYAASMQANAHNTASQASMGMNDKYRELLLKRSSSLSDLDRMTAQDQQYGKNLTRSNRNALNSGLHSGLYSSYAGKNQGLADLENQIMAGRMAARNQNANFNANIGQMQNYNLMRFADSLSNIKIPTRPANTSNQYYWNNHDFRATPPGGGYGYQMDPNQISSLTTDPYIGPNDPILTLPSR